MAWQTSTINPATTSPAQDISKIVNDLSVLKGVIGGTPDAAVPSTWTTALAALSQAFNSGTTGGTSTAYTLTPSQAIAAYTAGMTFWVTFHTACGAAPTLQVSGLASPPNLVKQLSDGTFANLSTSDIPTNHRSRVTLLSATQALVEDMPPAAGTQLQTINASVASSALTISASTLSLDFRSTTLGSGAVTRVIGTPANLVISSGSTLGTVNGVQSDIAVLAINNSGTIELAAVNLAGGNDLSETGLISTTAEGGAGAADSANVIYSTTARTNVAYRVIGIIRSTQATAGTWATAPSLVQGAGGNALDSMASVGYGQTWQDVGASRALGTTYTNSTGKPITLSVVCSASSSTVQLFLNINGGGAKMLASGIWGLNLCAVIPPGATYAVTTNGPGSINQWMELR